MEETAEYDVGDQILLDILKEVTEKTNDFEG